MRTIYVLMSIVLVSFNSYGQNIQFEKAFPVSPFPSNIAEFTPVDKGAMAFSDIDNDNDLDVVITGETPVGILVAIMYKNDGFGNYSEVQGTPFQPVSNGEVIFIDIDNDNDDDLLISGDGNSPGDSTKLYENDGFGNFIELVGSDLSASFGNSIGVADFNNDGDQDVLFIGSSGGRYYENDGAGNFTLVPGTSFINAYSGSVSVADVDNDGDQDVLITGIVTWNMNISKLYKNDGNGNFTEDLGNFFEESEKGTSSFADIDNDSDMDLLITGTNDNDIPISNLYLNDGLGNFTIVTGVPFDGIQEGTVSFADIDNDGDLDLMLSGYDGSESITQLYANDGNGNFTQILGTPFISGNYGFIEFGDVDGDSDLDLILNNPWAGKDYTMLYLNDGSGNFTEVTGTPFRKVTESSISFADIDNDNDLDVIVAGLGSYGDISYTDLYINDGVGNYSIASGTPFEGVRKGSVEFADIDNDGDSDVFLCGRNNASAYVSKLYVNDGSGSFTEVLGTPFDGVWLSSVAFADVDNDTDKDLLITGKSNSPRIAKLYKNDGNGNFTEEIGTPFWGVETGSIGFFDYDNDHYQDLLITGNAGTYQNSARLYHNDGNGNYTFENGTPYQLSAQNPFYWIRDSDLDIADVDNDNNLDVLTIGKYCCGMQKLSKLYKNNGAGVFSEIPGTPFTPVIMGTVNFSDVDNDGDQDVLITGQANSADGRVANLYVNDGAGNFNEELDVPFIGVSLSSVQFADIDNDNDNDLLISGYDSINQPQTILYRNETCPLYNIIDTIVACNNYTWIDGVTYTESNDTASIYITDTSSLGCDTLISLKLTLFNSPVSQDSIVTCDSLEWIDGSTYYATDSTSTYNVPGGCLVELDLTILYSTSGVESATACDYYTWIDGNIYTGSNNTASYNIVNGAANGCDSLVYLDLNIINASVYTDSVTSCDSLTWVDGVTYYSNVNSNSFLYPNASTNGCDSIVNLVLEINSSTYGVDSQAVCDNYTWIDGNTYTTDNNTAEYILSNSNGCDSTVTLNLDILNNTSDTTAIGCESFTWYGTTYTNASTPTHTFTNINGCDSVVTLNLTIVNIDTSITQGGIILQSNMSGADYQWLYCDSSNAEILGETYQYYTPSVNGNYSVEINKNNCVDTSSCYLINTVGIISNIDNGVFTIYPNPTTGVLHIEYEKNINQNINVVLYNIIGERVFETFNLQPGKKILLNNFPNGTYFLELQLEGGSQLMRKVIIQK